MAIDDDDPFAPADGTIMRPRPGGGRRPGSAPRTEIPSAEPTRIPPGTGQPPSRNFARVELEEFISGGRNPILQAAAPLLVIAARLQTTVSQADVHSLRGQATQQIKQFDDRLRAANVSSEFAIGARFNLCTFFDAAVLNTPWGAHSEWAGRSLLLEFHRVQDGGKVFFELLDKFRSEPSRYIDLLELQYVCLALGFEGRYSLEERGAQKLDELREELFRIIRDTRQLRNEELSIQWQGVEDRRNPIFRYVPWWIVGALALAVLAIGFVMYDARLKSTAAPTKELLASIGLPVQYTAAPAAPQTSRLKELLAPQERDGQLTVEDFGDKAVVTLTAVDLFRSGSVQVNPAHVTTLHAIARALNQVPGRVYVVGHTDDQPVHSLQYADNFELSRERAVAVANLMKGTIDDFSRIEWLGAGSTQPRYQPVNTAENRARNRRVEIIQMDSGAGSGARTGTSK
jgi:type VI secretion system protein ImpK